MEKRLNHWIRQIFLILLSLIFLYVLTIVPADPIYSLNRFVAPNLLLWLPSLVLIPVLCRLLHAERLNTWLECHAKAVFWSAFLGYGLVLLLLASQAFFYTGWDPHTISSTAQAWIEQSVRPDDPMLYPQNQTGYFSACPNNILLFVLEVGIGRLGQSFGLDVTQSAVILQGLLAWLTFDLLYLTARKLFAGNYTLIWIVMLLSTLAGGLSPWFVIPYTDGMGYGFPLLFLYLYLQAKETRPFSLKAVLSAALGFLAVFALRFKPQIFIVFLAIAIVFLLSLFLPAKDRKKESAKRFVSVKKKLFLVLICGLSMGLGQLVYAQAVLPASRIQIDPQAELGLPHYLMMGLNERTNGVFALEDVDFSSSFETKDERVKANLEEAGKRIEHLGIGGMATLLIRKAQATFGDGTFAWAMEGGFRKEIPDDTHSPLARFLHSALNPVSPDYVFFTTPVQIVWLLVLTLMLGLWRKRSCPSSVCSSLQAGLPVLHLSVTGLIVFELLFEARARYIFTFLPLFSLLAGAGLKQIAQTPILQHLFMQIRRPGCKER